MNKVLIIIPARKGSKGVKRKNIRNLNGKPLISWTIELALKFQMKVDLLVTTDDDDVISICKNYKIDYIKRPDNFATDSSTMKDVVEHVLLNKPNYERFILLQPTCPFRTENSVQKAIDILEGGSLSVIGVIKCGDYHPARLYIKRANGLLECMMPEHESSNRQELPLVYKRSGVIYAQYVKKFKENGVFYYSDSEIIENDFIESINIDEEIDFEFAEYVAKKS